MAPSASQAGQGEGRAHAPTGNTFEGVAELSEIDKYLCSVYWGTSAAAAKAATATIPIIFNMQAQGLWPC
jgi:hypothetical protein